MKIDLKNVIKNILPISVIFLSNLDDVLSNKLLFVSKLNNN